MNSNKKIARFAGLLYFIMAIIGAFSLLYVPSELIVPGDATATANNIATSELLFRLGAVSGLMYPVIFLVLVLTLYKLFKGANQAYASLMMVLVVAAVPIGFLNVLNQFAVLQLLGDADYMTVFEPDQLNAAVMFFLDLHSQGIITVEIFWGLWLLPLGLLVLKSGFVPKNSRRLVDYCLRWISGGFSYAPAVSGLRSDDFTDCGCLQIWRIGDHLVASDKRRKGAVSSCRGWLAKNPIQSHRHAARKGRLSGGRRSPI